MKRRAFVAAAVTALGGCSSLDRSSTSTPTRAAEQRSEADWMQRHLQYHLGVDASVEELEEVLSVVVRLDETAVRPVRLPDATAAWAWMTDADRALFYALLVHRKQLLNERIDDEMLLTAKVDGETVAQWIVDDYLAYKTAVGKIAYSRYLKAVRATRTG